MLTYFSQRYSKPALITVLYSLVSAGAFGQYFQFSQYNFTLQRINPAQTASTRFASVDIVSRNQKTGGDFSINSNFASASIPLLNPSTGTPWSGIGITVMNDQSAGIFKKQEASLSYAVHIRVSRYRQLSLGFKALYASQQINLDGFTTGAQFVPDRGFDPALNSGETFQSGRAHYTTFSAGVSWQQVNKKGDLVAQWGLSFFDLNKPTVSFLGNPTPVPASFVLTGSLQAWHNSDNSISPELLYTNSSGTNVLNTGLRLRHEMKSMPNQAPDKIDFIAKYVVNRSGIAGVQFHRENFSFGVSYDFPVFKSNPGNLGALEVGLTLRKIMETKSKKTTRKRQSDRQKAKAKNSVKRPPAKVLVKKPVKKDSVKAIAVEKIQVTKMDTAADKIAMDSITTNAFAGGIQREDMVVEKVTLHFHFDYNSVDLDNETEDYLNNLSRMLSEDPKLHVKITGHTDNTGSEKFNQKLSQRRADAIKNYLVHSGIEAERLEATGKGMTSPLNDNDTEEDQAKNRRVEIVLFLPGR